MSALLPLPFIGIIKEEDLEKAKEKTLQRKLKEARDAQRESEVYEPQDQEAEGLLSDEPKEKVEQEPIN